MNTFIDIFNQTQVKDSEGFVSEIDEYLASVRAYREERHGSKKWANMAAYTSANAIFKFRWIPGLELKSGMVIICDNERYKIVSVEQFKNLYMEVAAEKMEPSNR